MIARSTIDRLTITALALTIVMPFAALSPVKAAPANCAVEAQAIAAQASSADPKAAAKALRTARLAAALCEAGNGHEAAKKFTLARQQLDTSIQLADRR
ncbi:hypothetical protein [Sandarakinorhabdus oryzae]|uniref:hypothetical protein n=1 Tax=Sandarakinorhabdus oryzae TaxID=2675220 RepID=UPI0012E2B3F1|nr:hypothetical protein [Sandarakinorhabdus oryzae]